MFLKINPLDQFEIKKIIPIDVFGIDVSFTNFSLFLLMATFLACFIPLLLMLQKNIIPSKKQAFIEHVFEFVSSTIYQFNGTKGFAYFPLILTVFLFILMSNLIGILPGSFTPTSHIGLTFFIAAFLYITINIIGIIKNGSKFLRLFLPSNVPLFLAPLFVPLEIITFLSKPVTLSIRLFANETAGHIILEIFGMFVIMIAYKYYFIAAIPFIIHTCILGFELIVALLQAYIFCVLCCIYLHDALDLH